MQALKLTSTYYKYFNREKNISSPSKALLSPYSIYAALTAPFNF